MKAQRLKNLENNIEKYIFKAILNEKLIRNR